MEEVEMEEIAIQKILLLGFGNPARLDDGLGPALVSELEKEPLKGLSTDSNYQLTVEDACDIAQYEIVIFADASVKGKEPFSFDPLSSESPMSFSTHSVSPGAVLFLAESIFQAKTKAYLLGIRGYEFNEFEERLSEAAQENLSSALDFIKNFVSTKTVSI